MKAKKINLKPFIQKVEREEKERAKFKRLNEKLPEDTNEYYKYSFELMTKFAKQFKGKTIDIAVVKAWLYSQGFEDNEARLVLWNSAGKGIIDFDSNFNIKCL